MNNNKNSKIKINNKDKKKSIDSDNKLHKLELKLKKEKEKFIRLFAEFENHKKRVYKEQMEFFRMANRELITDILPILDDFERGIKSFSEIKNKSKVILNDIKIIKDKLIKVLYNNGLSVIKVKKGDIFNTDLHEAVASKLTKDKNLVGKVIKIVEKGYYLNNKVIRYVKVIIGK